MKVFSFCLYGPPNPKYYPLSMLQNIWLIGTHYPDWKVYLYVSPDVDAEFLEQVATYSNVVLKHTGKMGGINRLERLFAIDEPDVETMFVRDADSHVHWKDRWAINDFLSKPQFVVHVIRDHREHSAMMLAGMWGMHKGAGVSIKGLFDLYLKDPIDLGYGKDGMDQSFLGSYVYPYIWPGALVHYSNGRVRTGETGVAFPFAHDDTIYCGRRDDATLFKDLPMPTTKPVYPFLKFSR